MATKAVHFSTSNDTPVNKRELTSIKALLAYTAYDKKISEDEVRNVFSSHFGIKDIEKLPRNVYNDAIRFLVDIQTDMLN